MYPGLNPMAMGNRMMMATQGLAPYGLDCCSCLSNEEDYRVYAPDFLETEEMEATEHVVPTSFLQQYPGSFPGMSPYGAGTRMLTASMGLAPYGMDCCPCLGNEEDYRVYPVST
jgi:hypothetical protein